MSGRFRSRVIGRIAWTCPPLVLLATAILFIGCASAARKPPRAIATDDSPEAMRADGPGTGGGRSSIGVSAKKLLEAASSGDLETCRALVGSGTGVNSPAGETSPLHVASASGHVEVVQFLLANRADPNAADRHGLTPLHSAMLGGKPDVAYLLLDKGAAPVVLRCSKSAALSHQPLWTLSGLAFAAAGEYHAMKGSRDLAARCLWRAADEFDQGAIIYAEYKDYLTIPAQRRGSPLLNLALGQMMQRYGNAHLAAGNYRKGSRHVEYGQVLVNRGFSGLQATETWPAGVPDFGSFSKRCANLRVESRKRAQALAR